MALDLGEGRRPGLRVTAAALVHSGQGSSAVLHDLVPAPACSCPAVIPSPSLPLPHLTSHPPALPQQIQELAHISATRGLFGGAPTVERCLQELSSYSDHQIHGFALTHHKLLEKYILPQDSILSSAKVCVGRGGRGAGGGSTGSAGTGLVVRGVRGGRAAKARVVRDWAMWKGCRQGCGRNARCRLAFTPPDVALAPALRLGRSSFQALPPVDRSLT